MSRPGNEIHLSVGQGGINQRGDVQKIQRFLLHVPELEGGPSSPTHAIQSFRL